MQPSSPENADAPAAMARFLGRFAAREYWLAHEELESLWLVDRRDCYKGLIQLAAASLHHQRGNAHGTRVKLTSARELISAPQDEPPWIDRPGLVALLDRLLAGEWPEKVDLAEFVSVKASTAEAEELPYRVTRYADGYRTGRDPRRRD